MFNKSSTRTRLKLLGRICVNSVDEVQRRVGVATTNCREKTNKKVVLREVGTGLRIKLGE
jgi:hypothetical protein